MSPRWARRALGRMAGEGERFSIQGDFEEEYRRIREERGRGAARLWSLKQVFRSMPGFLRAGLLRRCDMFRNFLKIAVRNVRRHFGYSALNLAGLAVGLASCLLIFLWVQDALGFNRFHKNSGRLYRVYSELSFSDGRKIVLGDNSFTPLARLLKARVPEVAEATRITGRFGVRLAAGGQEHAGLRGGFVDPPYFRMFSHRFLEGDPDSALNDPSSCVLTRETARKIFGAEPALGRTLRVNDQYDVRVSGVIEDIPRQSDYRADLLLDFRRASNPGWRDGDDQEFWGGNPLETFVLMVAGARIPDAEKKMTGALPDFLRTVPGVKTRLGLQPLRRIHIENPEGGGLIRYVPPFSTAALIVLLIACFNFVNLTTARSGNRAKEVALRKTIGARRANLIAQFFGESLLMAFGALILALGLTALLLPAFSKLVGAPVTWDVALGGGAGIRLAVIVLIVAVLAGGYPALYLSAFRPLKVLRDARAMGARGARFRKVLVILQFALSIGLIILALGVSRQIRHLRGGDIGFDRDNVVSLTLAEKRARSYDAFKTDLLRNPGVLGVTRSVENPSWINSSVWDCAWDGQAPDQRVIMNFLYVDFDFFETFQMPFAAGRPFSREFSTDPDKGYIVNEAAVRTMGLSDPVGKKISIFGEPGTIVGVVRDFHFQPLSAPVHPMVLGMKPSWSKRNVFVRLDPARREAALGAVERSWRKAFPGAPFYAQEFAARYKGFYSAEERLENVVSVFAVLAVFVSCLGLFGLASFLAEQRTREVGIRKVLGATTGRVTVLLTREFVQGVAAAVLIAWPSAYLVLNAWLRGYASRIHPGVPMFLLVGAAALVLAAATVAFQAVRAARRNPAESVRCE